MTRDDATEKVFKCDGFNSGVNYKEHLVDGVWLLRSDVINFINKIYDDFELLNTSERLTCEGCKWYELINDSVTCRWCERYPRMPFKDYWESEE